MPTGRSAVAPELGAVCLILPSLIGPAEHLGILARAECHTNEAVLLLGPGLVALRGTALRWRALHAAHRLRGHRCPLLPRAASPCPAPRPALPPARADAQTSSHRTTELRYSAFADSVPELPVCFTPHRLPWRRRGAALPSRGNSAARPCQFSSGNELSHCSSVVYSDLFRVYLHIRYLRSSHQHSVDLILH